MSRASPQKKNNLISKYTHIDTHGTLWSRKEINLMSLNEFNDLGCQRLTTKKTRRI